MLVSAPNHPGCIQIRSILSQVCLVETSPKRSSHRNLSGRPPKRIRWRKWKALTEARTVPSTTESQCLCGTSKICSRAHMWEGCSNPVFPKKLQLGTGPKSESEVTAAKCILIRLPKCWSHFLSSPLQMHYPLQVHLTGMTLLPKS